MPKIESPKTGDVWDYPYLWAWQSARGETEGRKSRPTAVAIAILDDGGKETIYLLALTTKDPAAERTSLSVPQIERHRAGLSGVGDIWVILDEFNSDVVGQSFYLQPEARLGRFSTSFVKQIQRVFMESLRRGATQNVSRL